MVHSPLEVSEDVTKVPLIHSVYLPENENIVEQEDISMSRKIDQTLKIHKLEIKCIQNGDTYINFFKNADHEDPFNGQWYGDENEIICGHIETSESDDECQKQSPGSFYKKGVLKNFAKLTGKHLCQSLFFNKVAG